MKLVRYEKWGDDHKYTTVEFETESEGKIEFQKTFDEPFKVDCSDVTMAELNTAFEMVLSGVIKL